MIRRELKRITASVFTAVIFATTIITPCYAMEHKELEPVDISTGEFEIKDGLLLKDDVLYQTYNKNDDPFTHFKQEIEIDGDKYALAYVRNVKQLRADPVETKKYSWTSEAFVGDASSYEPKDEYVDSSGRKLKLVEKKLINTEEDAHVEYYEDKKILQLDEGQKVPSTLDFEVTDIDTNQTIIHPLQLKEQEVIERRWSDDFEFPIQISDYDADIFVLNGKDVKKGDPLINYADEFLDLLNLNPEYYKINSITWDGDEYSRNGTVYRNAVAKGEKYVQDVEATYGGDITWEGVKGQRWTAIYEDPAEEGYETIYTMVADVEYHLDNPIDTRNWFEKMMDIIKGLITAIYDAFVQVLDEHPVISVIGLVLIALFIIFLFSPKAKKKCIYNKDIKCVHGRHDKETCENCIHYYQNKKE